METSPPLHIRHGTATPLISPPRPHDGPENTYTVDLATLETQGKTYILFQPGRLLTLLVRALESQKAQLSAQLTLLRSSSTPSQPTTTPTNLSSTDAEILSASLNSSAYLSTTLLESNYRLSGVTSFLVRDPSPGGETLLGIRIESFSHGKFLAPHYLILSTRMPFHSKAAGRTVKSLSLRFATIPPHFDLLQLAGSCLPVGTPVENQRLDILVRELRRRIAAWNRRGEVLERIRQWNIQVSEAGNKDVGESLLGLGLGRMTRIQWDQARLHVEVEWVGSEEGLVSKVVGNIQLQEDGTVDKAVVMQYDERERWKAGSTQRMRKVERMLKVEGLSRFLKR